MQQTSGLRYCFHKEEDQVTKPRFELFPLIVVLGAALFSAACSKKVAKVAPPPPPAPVAPTATLAANPSVVQQGQPSELSWSTNNATDITIAGLGTLPASGSRKVIPEVSTTYTLIAKGPGGTQDATARVTVNPTVSRAHLPSDEELFSKSIKDVFFDYDRYNLRPDETPIAQNDASFLAQHPSVKVLIEGHCDDRGSEEYNLALGASRADTVKNALELQGVGSDRIKTISYGKEKPFCNQDDEQCWQQNRRDHFVFQQ
jgi:peptidoglycan-associated lipoprotein